MLTNTEVVKRITVNSERASTIPQRLKPSDTPDGLKYFTLIHSKVGSAGNREDDCSPQDG